MAQMKAIYLGKSGKVFGPYSMQEFDQMSVNGKLDDFIWMWNQEQKKWNPIEAAPPAPMLEVSGHPEKLMSWDQVKAICYDLNHLVSGTLESITQTGCKLVAPAMSKVPSNFLKNKTHLNLVDKKSGKSITLPVQMFRHAYDRGECHYWLRWDEVPEAFKNV